MNSHARSTLAIIVAITLLIIPLKIKTSATDEPSSWAVALINEAKALGLATNELVNGYHANTTRAEFCRAAVNLLRKNSYNIDGVTPKLFADTSDRDIGIAAAIGITSGTDSAKNLFSPNNTLTREQAATLLRNVLSVLGADTRPPPGILWTDANEIASWAQTSADLMYSAGIMGGTSTAALVFSPKTPYTHEQSIITLLYLWNYIQPVEEQAEVPAEQEELPDVDLSNTYSFKIGGDTSTLSIEIAALENELMNQYMSNEADVENILEATSLIRSVIFDSETLTEARYKLSDGSIITLIFNNNVLSVQIGR
jgi:hypothetical protein